jgi:predicted kinase
VRNHRIRQDRTGSGLGRTRPDPAVGRRRGPPPTRRYGIDYPEHEYFDREALVVDDIRAQLIQHLTAGTSVVLDHGLWLRNDRDAWRRVIGNVGGTARLVYLPVDKTELLRRLTERNQREDANALTVTPEALDDFFARFDPPDPDEHAVVYTGGDPRTVLE